MTDAHLKSGVYTRPVKQAGEPSSRGFDVRQTMTVWIKCWLTGPRLYEAVFEIASHHKVTNYADFGGKRWQLR